MKRFDRGILSRALFALPVASLILHAPASPAQQPAQNPVARRYVVLDYMKVAPGKDNDYVRLEREVWKPFHAQRIKDKRLVAWELYDVRYTADTHRDYDYVTVNVYDNLAATDDQTGNVEMFQRMHPGNDGARLLAETDAARQTVRSEIWELLDRTTPLNATAPPARYLNVAFMQSKPNVDAIGVERELWKPVHQELVRTGAMNFWGLYALVMPGGTSYPYDYATVNGLSSLSALENLYPEDLFRRVHPKIPLTEIGNRTAAARDLTRNELWVLVDATP
ncbi:MAG: hypothetical protein ACREMS_04715 [Gemmatimonadaceae bacterium]